MKLQNAFIALLAMFALVITPAAYAADNGTEFGVEDDLTVLGTGGNATPEDPDVEVKGFSVFGATQTSYTGLPAPQAGDVVINGRLAVSSGTYFVGSSTLAGGAYFTGVSSFSTPGNIFVTGGTAGQVLKKAADGSMQWANDTEGAGEIAGQAYRLVMYQPDGTGGIESLFLQNAGNSNITLLSGSSMTIKGAAGGFGLGVESGLTSLGGGLAVTGDSSLNGKLSVSGAFTVSAGSASISGNAGIGGALSVASDALIGGNAGVAGNLNVTGASYFGAAATKSTFSATGQLDIAPGADIVLTGAGAQVTLPNAPSAGTDAANKDYVDSRTSSQPWTRDDAIAAVKLSTITDSVGIGIAAPLAKLHVSSANANASDSLLIVSSGTLASQQVLTMNASGDLFSKGDSQIGSSNANTHGINRADEAGVALAVEGGSGAGAYVTKFYSGSDLAAWIRRK